MFDSEYKTMMEKVAPDQALITQTALKMQAMKDTNRKSPRMRRGFAVLAALVVIGVIGASAVTLSQRKLVEWNGNLLGVRMEAQEREQEPGVGLPWKLLNGAPENELWLLNSSKWSTANTPQKIVPTLEGIKQASDSTAPKFLFPTYIPDGYAYTEGYITFYASPATREGLTLVSEEWPQTGVSLKKYALPDTVFDNLNGYNMSFRDSAGHKLFIRCERMDATSNFTFSMAEDAVSQSVEIDETQQGLYLESLFPGFRQLFLRKDMVRLSYYEWAFLGDSQISLSTFDSAVYQINADFLEKDQLIQIAQGLK